MKYQKKIFSPIKKSKRAFEEVSLEIKKLILNGVLGPGERLPSETELAHQFNVSRPTIREALRTLELSGFLIIKTGVNGGPIVQNTLTSTISNLYLDAFQMEKITLEELTDARMIIEGVIIGRVIDNIEKSDIENLKNNIQEAKKKLEHDIMATEENIEFHRLLAKASKNPVFLIVAKSITDVVGNLLSRAKPDTETSKNVVEYHEKILKAVIEKKRDEAIS
ncbi:MAG: FadR family transcriptional regulator, partial [Deltaproteobacteria bacterium]|nr:FadR family transcriptional regulator [Deltaproteobacteria bacterium]